MRFFYYLLLVMKSPPPPPPGPSPRARNTGLAVNSEDPCNEQEERIIILEKDLSKYQYFAKRLKQENLDLKKKNLALEEENKKLLADLSDYGSEA